MAGEWGTVPQWISASAALTGVAIAFTASRAWSKTLKSKRGDDLLAAVFDVQGAIGSLSDAIQHRVSAPIYGAHIDRVYASFLNLEKAHVIASRSFKLKEAELAKLLHQLDGAVAASRHLINDRVLGAEYDLAEASFKDLGNNAARIREYIRTAVGRD